MPKLTAEIDEVVACLDGGGVALLPTDTVFGLAARPDRPAAVDRIFALKRRPRTAHLPLLVSSRQDIEALGATLNDTAARLLRSDLMPGALTLILAVDPARAPAWLKARDEVAVRLPDDERCLAIIARTGPIFATSANLHGAGNARDADTILAGLNGAPDIVLTGRVASEIASTIVHCREPWRIERQGQISADAIARVLADG